MAIFEPGTNGLTSVMNLPTLSTRAGMEYRGNTTLNAPKKQLRIETWLDDRDEEKDISPFGMSSDGDWLTIAGYQYDLALMRPSLMFELDRQIGNWSPRTIFVEVYINTDGGAMSSDNYMGVSAFGEKINRAADRVDLARLDPDDTAEPDISGGYLFRDNWATEFSAGGLDFDWQYPDRDTMDSPPYATQKQWLIDYINEAKTVLDGPSFADPATGYAKYIDVESYIDYHWFTFLAEDPDAFRASTFYHKHRGGKLRMGPHWDFDRTMGSNDNRDNYPFTWLRESDPSLPFDRQVDYFKWGWLDRLFQDVDFYQQWIDRWFEHREGVLSTTNVNAVINSMSNSIGTEAAARNFAKWDVYPPRTSTHTWTSGELDGTWSGEVQHMAAWLEARSSWIDDQFLGRPSYNQEGGFITNGFELVISGPVGATHYYTLDGTDPRAPGGAPSAAALEYTGPVLLSSNVIVVSRAFDSTWVNGAWQTGDLFATTLPWSAPREAVFQVVDTGTIVPASAANLAVTELMYNPAAPTAGEISAGFTSESFFEYIEVMNIGTDTIDLTGVNFVLGITFTFPSLMTLPPNERAVVARNEAGFLARHPGAASSLVAGEYGIGDTNKLENGGELIVLTAADGSVIRSFTYDDVFPWPESPDGFGPSLVLIAPESDPDHGLAANWRPSIMSGGAPGASDASAGFTGDPHDDLDGNGQEDFLDYGLAGSSPPMTVVFDPVAGTGTMTFLRNLAADDVIFDVVTSTDLINWTPGGAIRIASLDHGDGTATETWQAVLPLEVEDTWFIRLKLTGR